MLKPVIFDKDRLEKFSLQLDKFISFANDLICDKLTKSDLLNCTITFYPTRNSGMYIGRKLYLKMSADFNMAYVDYYIYIEKLITAKFNNGCCNICHQWAVERFENQLAEYEYLKLRNWMKQICI